MQFGYDDNGIRVRPSFSGQKATCPFCHGTIIGKCGEVYVWHWQHQNDRECDTWQEHETEWHRKWKQKFPDSWQEVIIEKNLTRHIADVRTEKGLVIEFQNSSISTSTITVREDFYESMIWVVNARSFRDNFTTKSVVYSKLRNIEQNASYDLLALQDNYNSNLKVIVDNIEKNQVGISDKIKDIKDKTTVIENLNKLLQEKDVFIQEILAKWSEDEFYWDSLTNDITQQIASDSKNQLYEIPEDIRKLKTDRIHYEQSLQDISNLEDYQIAGNNFKFIQYKLIHPSSFPLVRAIPKASRTTFFPEVIKFSTELEFKNIKSRKELYDFAIDPTNFINSYGLKIRKAKETIGALENSLKALRKNIADQLAQELENKIKKIEDDLEILSNEFSELIKKKSRLEESHAKFLSTKDSELSELKAEIERKKNDQRFQIMNKNKGLYIFEWKHERKTWKAANSTLFFDIGESYLLQKIKDGLFYKMEIDSFLKRHLSN